VETPDDVDYRHTGAFKLGSLRITNGVASPTPSIERAVTMSVGEDYISAGHIRKISQGHFRMASNRSNTLSIAGEKLKSPWIVREESPLRKSQKFSDAPPQLDDSILDLDSSLADFDFDSTLESLKDNRPSTSEEMADGYIQDIALSPYSHSPLLEAPRRIWNLQANTRPLKISCLMLNPSALPFLTRRQMRILDTRHQVASPAAHDKRH
jgi:hypothetical protein